MLYRFILPRYYSGIAGGAETLVGEIAGRLAQRGERVEILTTCARDNRTWENYFEPGEEKVGEIVVRRFSVSERDLDTWVPLQLRLSDNMMLSVEEELLWMEHSVLSHDLLRYLAENPEEQELRFFAPYLFGTTFWGAMIRPEVSVLIPCLHDEVYARLSLMKVLFQKVRGLIFNALAESSLAERLFGNLPTHGVVGMGFEDVEPLHSEHISRSIQEQVSKGPYLLYLGRKETGKNVGELIEGFLAYKQYFPDSSLRLFVCGGGDFSDLGFGKSPSTDQIVDIQHVSESDKQYLLQSAVALVQPSRNESFSIVLMEAWLRKCPVVVDAQCEVTREHVLRSGGGLYVAGIEDYIKVFRRLEDDLELQKLLGNAGRNYVRTTYDWDSVLERWDAAVGRILGLNASETAILLD